VVYPPKTVTHPSRPTNWARRRVTSLIRPSMLPLRHTFPSKLPIPMGVFGPHLIHDSLSQPRPRTQNGISIGSAVFEQMTAECPYTLQWAALPLPQNCPLPCGMLTPSNTWFLGPTQVLNPNGISIGSAIFAGLRLATVADRLADHATLVGNNRPHL